MDLYIYYRVREDAASLLQERVGHMQQQLRNTYGVVAALKRRPMAKAGYHTWMEIYLDTPAGFEDGLAHAVAAAGITSLISDNRHCEHFIGMDPCA